VSSRITTSLLAAAVAAAAITPATAHAYRTYADDPEVRYPARWYSSSQVWQLSSAGLAASGLSDSQALETLRSAFTTLSGPTCEHALPEITVSGVGGAARADDGTNTIEFVSDWSSRGLPAGRGATTDLRIPASRSPIGRIRTPPSNALDAILTFAKSGPQRSIERELGRSISTRAGATRVPSGSQISLV
jgi:hypothetical protein